MAGAETTGFDHFRYGEPTRVQQAAIDPFGFDHFRFGEPVVGLIALPAPAGFLPPAGLTADAVSSSQIDLAWSTVATATGYDIERGGVVIVTNNSDLDYSDTGLDPNTEYSYRVRSRKTVS